MNSDIISVSNQILSDLLVNYPSWALYCLVAIIGCSVGSFLNVVIYRKPLLAENDEAEYVSANYGVPALSKPQVGTKRSHCPDCLAQVPARFNIPIFGWLLLKGRTNCCNKQLSLMYPLVEITTGALYLLIFHLVGEFNTTLISMFVMVASLIVICCIDFRHKIIFDLHAALYCVSGIFTLYQLNQCDDFIIDALIVLIMMALFIKCYEALRNKVMKSELVMMGDGDWSLWMIFFASCVVYSQKISPTTLLETIAIAILIVLCLGVLTISLKHIGNRIQNGKATYSQEFPAAPAITITTLGVTLLILVG